MSQTESPTATGDARINGTDIHTGEQVSGTDYIGRNVVAQCSICGSIGKRRLLDRDYSLQAEFKTLDAARDSTVCIPPEIYRRCDECGEETTHLVC